MFSGMEEMVRIRQEEIRREYREARRGHPSRLIRNLWKRLQKQKSEQVGQGGAGCPAPSCC
ncbi:hypothetical protein C8P63_11776 [Melghirimyces profundicolus]|uniref:Uncharacterized protein n=1 Tax=Melghirimyces profundicolus TaxID=1242148 RepID=A0A2T6BQI1_9BACL|nr:hypothetical protein C8P63_11776 [Melghirimyces profundicolus]